VCDDGNACTEDVCIERDDRCRHDGVAACCLTDADCADADACTTNERCEAGRCTSDAVVCTAPEEECRQAVCDPTRGCESAAVRDGTACDDGDPCTRSDTCSAGACGASKHALGTEPMGGLAVTKFVLKRAGKRGVQLTAQGYFTPDGPIDPPATGARLEMRHGDTMLFDLELPAAAFRTNGPRTRFAVAPGRGSDLGLAGLKRLELRVSGATVDVTVKGMLSAGSAGAAATRSSGTPAPDATVAWALWLGGECVSDPDLHCDNGRSSAKRCR
jgi:hypothetical protein